MIEALMLRHSNLSKVFEVACDALGVGIGGVLGWDGHSFAYFTEKLNAVKQWYFTYDKRVLCSGAISSSLALLSVA